MSIPPNFRQHLANKASSFGMAATSFPSNNGTVVGASPSFTASNRSRNFIHGLPGLGAGDNLPSTDSAIESAFLKGMPSNLSQGMAGMANYGNGAFGGGSSSSSTATTSTSAARQNLASMLEYSTMLSSKASSSSSSSSAAAASGMMNNHSSSSSNMMFDPTPILDGHNHLPIGATTATAAGVPQDNLSLMNTAPRRRRAGSG